MTGRGRRRLRSAVEEVSGKSWYLAKYHACENNPHDDQHIYASMSGACLRV